MDQGLAEDELELVKLARNAAGLRADIPQIVQDCKVPVENRLGEENNGFYLAVGNFQWERLWIAISTVASAQRSMELAIEYASNRTQFGKALTSMQVIDTGSPTWR